MADNRVSALQQEIWSEQAMAMRPHMPKKISKEWLTQNRLTNYLMGKGDKKLYPVRIKKGFKGLHYRWDKSVAESPAGLNDWGSRTEMVINEHAAQQRLEMGLYDWAHAVDVTELDKERLGSTQALRDFARFRLDEAKGHVKKLLNQQLATGSGLAQKKADGGYHVFGYQTLLATSIAGEYAKVARSGNSYMQHQIVDGDGGPNTNWEDDSEERVKKTIITSTVDIDGREMSPNLGLTTRQGIHDLEENVKARERIINQDASDPYNVGPNGIIVKGVPIFYENTIAEATKRCFLLDTKAMRLIHAFKETVKMDVKDIVETYGMNVAHVLKGRLALIFEHIAPNAVIHWA